MPCSAITLSLATICAVVSVALLAIAFGTDNWQYIRVNRIEIQQNLGRSDISPQEFDDEGLYRTRTKGLFRICYPDTKPKGEDLYLSPVETYCQNIDYHIFNDESDTSQFTDEEMVRLHMARSMIALFIVSFFFVFVAFWTGVAGCWRRSPGNIASTAILMLLACLFSAGGMGLWHGVEYYEDEKLKNEPWKASWNQILQDATSIQYDWSYMISWIGTGMALLAFCLFLGGSQCMQGEQQREQAKRMQFVPVYPQKQQYLSYDYGYSGPYHYGAQYAPYNYRPSGWAAVEQ